MMITFHPLGSEESTGPCSKVEVLRWPISLWVQRQKNTDGSFDLWCCRTEDIDSSAFSNAKVMELLSEVERLRVACFRFENDRRLFLLTRLLVRSVLTQYADIGVHNWAFSNAQYGKPEIASGIMRPFAPRKINFNVSHTGSLVVCAVSQTGMIGVDVEDGRRSVDAMGMASIVMAEGELASLRKLPRLEQRDSFLKSWVVKEAYAKAIGVGVGANWRNIVVHLAPFGTGLRTFRGTCSVSQKQWFVTIERLYEHYLVAVAFCRVM